MSIDSLFRELRSRSIEYRGQTIWRLDEIPVSDGDVLQLVFEKATTRWHQGVTLKLSAKGTITINNHTTVKGARVWRDRAPSVVPFRIGTRGPNTLLIHNVWDTGAGTPEAWIGNHAMIVTKIPNGRRYQCNDGYDDEDFEDLIFRIERIPPEEAQLETTG